MIQGIIHSLYKESSPPYFDARQLSTQDIVKCLYKQEDYRLVVNLLQRRDAVVIVSGLVEPRMRLDRKITEIRIERMRSTEPLSDAEFAKLQGAAPELTGRLSTDDFIERQRRRDNGDE